MTQDPADGQDATRPETEVTPGPPSDSSAPHEHVAPSERSSRSSGRAWGFDPVPLPSTTPGEMTAEGSESAATASGAESPSWFARIREQRDPNPGETGVPREETSEDTVRFSAPLIDATFVHDSPDEPAEDEASPANHDGASPITPSPTRRIVMVKRARPSGFLPRIAQFLGVTEGSVPTGMLGAILIGCGILTLAALLANGNGVALTILSAIVPLLLAITLVPLRGSMASDANLMLAVTALNGVIAGGILGWLASRIVAASWFDEGVLNFGAIGFGGHYAHDAGVASWLVWLLCGLVLPIVALPASLIAPALAFRSGRYPNSAGNGQHLGTAAGAGFAIGTAAVFWAPLNVHSSPSFTTSDWTLMTMGVAILTPSITIFATTLVGIGLWHVLRLQTLVTATIAITAGIAGMLALRLGSLVIQPRQEHLWLEFAWTAIVAVAVAGLYSWVIRFENPAA